MTIPYVSTKDASIKLNISEQRIRSLLRNGVLSGEQIGKTWVVSVESIYGYQKQKIDENLSDKKGKKSKNKKIKALSFFSGAMGLDLGLEKAGIEIVLACEVDKRCRQTILENRPNVALIGDINAYKSEDILEYAGMSAEEIDLIVGGPPCQAFSTAGSRRGFNDDRGNVFLTYIDLILTLRPQYAVIENVRGLLSAPLKHRPHSERGDGRKPLYPDEKPSGALEHILWRLREGGYSISFNLYNAANFGVPQVRERVVIVCHRDNEKVPYLYPTHSSKVEFGLRPWRTLRDAIGDLDNSKAEYINFPEERLKYYRLLTEGQYWKHLPVGLQKEALGRSYYSGGGKTGFFRRLAWDKPSCTLVTHPAMPATDICHPEYDRPLSIQEYKRIQQFPDDWVVCGSIIDQYRQIGNAVPIGLGKAIGKTIIDHMNGLHKVPPQNFPFSRYQETSDTTWNTGTRKTQKKAARSEDCLQKSFF
jgi:DNA (cytosine-5)-methyltransferase 1